MSNFKGAFKFVIAALITVAVGLFVASRIPGFGKFLGLQSPTKVAGVV